MIRSFCDMERDTPKGIILITYGKRVVWLDAYGFAIWSVIPRRGIILITGGKRTKRVPPPD